MYDAAPIYTSGPGTLIDEMIHIAGGRNIAKSNDPIDPESVIQAQPDVIICTPDLEKRVEQMPAWKGAVPAVTNTAYFHCSNNATLIRAGARLAAGAEELARFLHPELFTSDGKPASQIVSSPASGRSVDGEPDGMDRDCRPALRIACRHPNSERHNGVCRCFQRYNSRGCNSSSDQPHSWDRVACTSF